MQTVSIFKLLIICDVGSFFITRYIFNQRILKSDTINSRIHILTVKKSCTGWKPLVQMEVMERLYNQVQALPCPRNSLIQVRQAMCFSINLIAYFHNCMYKSYILTYEILHFPLLRM